jgi:hypothetical protein
VTAVRLDVSHQGVLGLLFVVLRHVEQDIEPAEIRIVFDHRSGLLALDPGQFMNGSKELGLEAAFLATKPDLRDMYALLSDPYIHQISNSFVRDDSPTHSSASSDFRQLAYGRAI